MTESQLPVPALAAAQVHRQRTGPNPATVYLARLAPGSRRTMRGALAIVAAICVPDAEVPPDPERFPWWSFRAEHAKAVRAVLAETYKYTTANKTLSALRGVLREAWELGLMETEHYHRAATVRAVKGSSASAATGRSLARGELRALIEACLTPVSPRKGDAAVVTEKGQRDAALVALGYGCGLRRDELATLGRRRPRPGPAPRGRARQGQQDARRARPAGRLPRAPGLPRRPSRQPAHQRRQRDGRGLSGDGSWCDPGRALYHI